MQRWRTCTSYLVHDDEARASSIFSTKTTITSNIRMTKHEKRRRLLIVRENLEMLNDNKKYSSMEKWIRPIEMLSGREIINQDDI